MRDSKQSKATPAIVSTWFDQAAAFARGNPARAIFVALGVALAAGILGRRFTKLFS